MFNRQRFRLILVGLVALTTAWFALAGVATALFTTERVLHNRDWEPVVTEMDGGAMVLVPAGCLRLGFDTGPLRLRPVQPHCIDAPFWLDRTEVTNAQYARCVEAGVCSLPRRRTFYTDPAFADHPVVGVDWTQAATYARWRGGCLPTEMQWAFAARGPDGWLYPWGDEFAAERVVAREGQVIVTRHAAPVASRPGGASWVGAHDMSGNAWEWTATVTHYGESTAPTSGGCAPHDLTQERLVIIRGGSFLGDSYDVQALTRLRHHPSYHSILLGFRVMRPA